MFVRLFRLHEEIIEERDENDASPKAEIIKQRVPQAFGKTAAV